VITVKEATNIVLENARDFGTEEVALEASVGRILKEPLIADRDFPPFTRVSMDGIAIQYEVFEKGRRVFDIEGIQPAGAPPKALKHPENCLEVMTGAVLPDHTDTVIRYEDVEISGGKARILIEDIRAGQNAHRRASDRQKGDLLVRPNRLISPAEIGVAATVGKTTLKVAVRPRTVIISTGDELVDVRDTPLPHQIRRSNAHMLSAALRRDGISADHLHMNDDRSEIRDGLRKCLNSYDVLLMSGGVSKGKFDFIPEILEELRVEKLFHKVRQRPGKPFWFGRSEGGALVFAFPGNPASTFMCATRYFRPWLRAGFGLAPFEEKYAVLEEDFEFAPALTYFLQAVVSCGNDGRLTARPVAGRGSGDLANLADVDGFLELPENQSRFEKGTAFRLFSFR